MLGEIDSLPMEYRWSTRAILLDPEEARGLLDKTRRKWRSRIRGLKDQILKTQNGAVNIYAKQMAEDAEQAMGVAASGDVQFAQYSSNIICLDEDLDRLHENTRLVMKKIQNLGFCVPSGNHQRRRGLARQLARRWIPECPPGSPAHAEPGGYAADHFGLGGSSRESLRG